MAERQRSGVSSASSDDGTESRIASRVEASTLQDLASVDALLKEFVDAPIESLRRAQTRSNLAVPEWLNKTVCTLNMHACQCLLRVALMCNK